MSSMAVSGDASNERWAAAVRLAADLTRAAYELQRDSEEAAVLIRIASANVGTRSDAFRVLQVMDPVYTVGALDAVLDGAETARDAAIARELLGRVPRPLLARELATRMSERLDRGDYWVFRRMAEVLEHLGAAEELASLCARAKTSEDPDTREVARDFST